MTVVENHHGSPDLAARKSIGASLPWPDPHDVSTVLVHDWLTGMRGGEKVLEALCKLFPQAPIFTLLHNRGSVSRTIESHSIRVSPLQYMPFADRKYRHYLPLFPAFAEMNRAENCDLVISTSHAVAKAMVRRRGGRPFHVCYIHTPMRYVWDRFDDYFGPDRVGPAMSRFVFKPMARGLRKYDRQTADRVDVFVANSTFVAERVRGIYKRDALVIAPPVDIDRFRRVERKPDEWYLVVSALVPYKRVDHAIAACARLGRRLKIVGSGPEERNLRMLATNLRADVEFAGFVDDQDLGKYYGNARALLFPGVEDFGIVPVEAIASGCPVVALGIGGVLDSMTAETAVFYAEESVDGLARSIREFEDWCYDPVALRSRAEAFSETVFVNKFAEILSRGRFLG